MSTTIDQHAAQAGDEGPAGAKAGASSSAKPNLAIEVLSAIARFGLAYIWISAGWAKIGNHLAVTKTIEAYEIFTPYWSELLARIIGPVELAGGLFLLLGVKLRASGWVSLAALGLFIIGLWSAYSRGLAIDCGCFDASASQGGDPKELLWTIARDVAYMAITVFMMYRPFKRFAIYP